MAQSSVGLDFQSVMKPHLRHIAVVAINRDKYSETFIHDSFDFFPCKKSLLYGEYLPTHVAHDRLEAGAPIPISKAKFWERNPSDARAQQERNVRTWLLKQRPDVVLAHYGPSGVAMAAICAELQIPLVVHFHGYDAYRADILGSHGLHYPAMFQAAQAIVVVSQDMHAQLLLLGATVQKLRLHIYGVNPARFSELNFPAAPFTFLFVGRFVPKKAPDLVLRAFAIVQRLVPEVRLRMVGDGELRVACERLAAELGLGDAIVFEGILDPERVAQVLTASHVLVLPSCRTQDGDSEGTPLVILEAGAAARAVVATRHGGITDVLTDGSNGLLVPENDPQALAAAMLRLASNPNEAAAMGLRARERVCEAFSQRHYHQNLWKLLENAVDFAQNS